MKNKGRLWNVKRTVVEEFQVWASSKKEALLCEKEPHKITIVKETARPSAPLDADQVA